MNVGMRRFRIRESRLFKTNMGEWRVRRRWLVVSDCGW